MDVFLVIVLLLILAAFLINVVSHKFRVASVNYLWTLFAVHFLMTIAYIITASYSSSDSFAYFKKSSETETWGDLFGTGTIFISFLGWIFAHLMNLSYYSVMLIFSFFGFLSTLVFYITAKENIELKPVWGHFTYVELVFLLPNLHYWSSSLGKGSVILFGLASFAFGLSRFDRRILPLITGAILIYMVRPHILFTMILSIMLGVLLTSSGIKWYLRWFIFLTATIVFFSISDNVVEYAETDSLNILNSSSLSHRVQELSKATSGIDIQNYNIFMKMFTFWFRPLFFDGTSAVSLVASVENLFYLFMFIIIIRDGILNWRHWNGWFKICFFFFLLGSVILAQVSGNLGIAMRQKAQMMPFFFIIFCKALTYRKQYMNPATSMQ
jgi:hypothetical protein